MIEIYENFVTRFLIQLGYNGNGFIFPLPDDSVFYVPRLLELKSGYRGRRAFVSYQWAMSCAFNDFKYFKESFGIIKE